MGDRVGSARWPLVTGPAFDAVKPRDPWAMVVHRSIGDYRDGAIDEARRTWDDGIVWRVVGAGPTPDAVGPDAVVDHHARLLERTSGTFRQTLVSLECSNGPIVEAHVRTTATRGDRNLDIPTLIVFELSAMRICQVTEIPGDVAAWEAFWAD